MAVARDAARLQGRSHIWKVFGSNAIDKGCYLVWLTVLQTRMEVNNASVVQFELLKLAFQGSGPSDALLDIISAFDPSLFAGPTSWTRAIALWLKSAVDLGRLASTASWFQESTHSSLSFPARRTCAAESSKKRL